jgi:hypothetical protein
MALALLFVDLLGVRSRWLTGGRSSVEKAFALLDHLVADAIRAEDGKSVLDGAVEADSAAIVCETVDVALRIATRLYCDAFVLPKKRLAIPDHRLWLRGAIIPMVNANELRTVSPLLKHSPQVRRYSYAEELLEAISIEKSGFKGMRLLVDKALLTNTTRSLFSIPIGKCFFVPFQRLRHSSYPGRTAEGFQDYLWMATPDGDAFETIRKQMDTRLRWAANSAEEFQQAAATQVVFHECLAMMTGLRSKNWQKRDRRRKA